MRFIFTLFLMTFAAHTFAAPLTLNVNLLMDGEPLDWDATYNNAAGQDFTINLLKFYVSNVALVNSDGTEVELDGLELTNFEPGDATTGATFMTLDAPEGLYSGIRFDIGVPRELNHLDATSQQAPLGVDSGMYWAWNPGYIFYRIEGRTEVAGSDQPWLLHMGTDAFRLPVRIQDLLTGTVTVDISSEGSELSFDLDLMQAFSQGLNGGDYDFSNDAYRAVHGGPISAQAYTNSLNALTLTETTAEVEEVQEAGETAEVEAMQGEDITDDVQDETVEQNETLETGEAEMDHSNMADAEDTEENTEMDHSNVQDTEDAEAQGDMDHSTMADADTESSDAETDHSNMADTTTETPETPATEAPETEATAASSAIIAGDISGTVSVSGDIEWENVIVLACTRDDAADRRCETPIIIRPEVEDAQGDETSFSFSEVPAGEYMVYALNDADGNEAHTAQGAQSEEIGVWLVPGTFDALFVSPPTTGISLELSSAQ